MGLPNSVPYYIRISGVISQQTGYPQVSVTSPSFPRVLERIDPPDSPLAKRTWTEARIESTLRREYRSGGNCRTRIRAGWLQSLLPDLTGSGDSCHHARLPATL